MNIKYLVKDILETSCKVFDNFLEKVVFKRIKWDINSKRPWKKYIIINERREYILNLTRSVLGQFFTYFLVKATEYELMERGSRHNTDCWTCPFGWKYADLDDGCCGIGDNKDFSRYTVTFDVGGHATFCAGFDILQCDDLDDDLFSKIVEIYNDQIYEVMCGIGHPGDWSGDDWCIYFHENVEVPWERYLGIFRDPGATANKIIKAAIKHTDAFEKDIVLAREIQHKITVDFEENYQEILEAYDI